MCTLFLQPTVVTMLGFKKNVYMYRGGLNIET